MLQGTVKRIVAEKGFGFIRTSQDREYFFHRQGFDGHWEDLVTDWKQGTVITVEFEPTRTDKGLRAEDVRRVGNGY